MDNLHATMLHTVNTFAMRLHAGPPLNEFEYCLYQQTCCYLENYMKLNRLQMEKVMARDFPDEQKE